MLWTEFLARIKLVRIHLVRVCVRAQVHDFHPQFKLSLPPCNGSACLLSMDYFFFFFTLQRGVACVHILGGKICMAASVYMATLQ